MKRGETYWKEIVYTDIADDEELMTAIKTLEEGREGSDGAPTVVEPEIDGTFTVSRRFWIKSEWDEEETKAE